MPDIPCPHCGQDNEKEREVCWACCKFLKPQEMKPKEQRTLGPFSVTRTTRTKININGTEYARLEDVPEPFQSKLKEGIARARPSLPKPAAERLGLNPLPEAASDSMAKEPTSFSALTIAAGYGAVVAPLLALWAEWDTIVRRNEAWWKGFPDFIKKTSPHYYWDHYHPHFMLVCLAVFLSACVYSRVRSFQTSRRSIRGVDAAIMLFLALAGFWIASKGDSDPTLYAIFGHNYYFSPAYYILGLILLFWTREPGQRLTFGPVSFSLDPLPTSEPLDFDPDVSVAPPDGFRFEDNGLERRISWRWFSWESMKGIFFAAMFGVPFAFVFYVYRHSPANSWPPSGRALLLLLAAPPALIAYTWLTYLVNRTILCVDAVRVCVRHGPLPCFGARDVLKADIARVVSEQSIKKRHSSDGTAFEPRMTYGVKLLLKGGKTLKLVTGLLAPDQAMFIEQQIRRA